MNKEKPGWASTGRPMTTLTTNAPRPDGPKIKK